MQNQPDYSLPKSERLCHESTIATLFKTGENVFLHPFKLIFQRKETVDDSPTQVLFSVSKRNFKLATSRNWVKRRLRELYRTHKHLFQNAEGKPFLQYLAIVYVAKEKLAYDIQLRKWKAVGKKVSP